jgi:hypothetical protein
MPASNLTLAFRYAALVHVGVFQSYLERLP